MFRYDENLTFIMMFCHSIEELHPFIHSPPLDWYGDTWYTKKWFYNPYLENWYKEKWYGKSFYLEKDELLRTKKISMVK